MGLDLRLYVISRLDSESTCPNHLTDTVLDVPRNSKLFAEIETLRSKHRLNRPVYHSPSAQRIEKDDYDVPLCAVTAGDLATLRESPELYFNPWLRAVFAYVKELPPDTRVVLYWH